MVYLDWLALFCICRWFYFALERPEEMAVHKRIYWYPVFFFVLTIAKIASYNLITKGVI